MDAKVEPHRRKRKKVNPTTPLPRFHSPLSPSFSSLPDEIIVNCLARISISHYRSLSLVSKSFHSFISSPYLYAARSQIRATEPRLYFCLRWSRKYRPWSTLGQTLTTNGWFTLDQKDELTLVPRKLPPSNFATPLKSSTVAVGYEIYQIGASNKNKRSTAVRVLDCRSHTWRYAPNMSEARKRAKCFFLEDKIYVMGGCSSKSVNWGEVFDVKTQTWKRFPRPKDGVYDTHIRVVAFGGKLYIITRHEKYGYDPKEERWLLESGLVGLERHITGRLCVIENVIFTEHEREYRWYDSRREEWLNVKGLEEDLYMKHGCRYCPVIKLVNYGEKLVIILEDMKNKRIWFAVIKLEKRNNISGLEIWGKIEQLKAVDIDPNSYKLLSCLSVLL